MSLVSIRQERSALLIDNLVIKRVSLFFSLLMSAMHLFSLPPHRLSNDIGFFSDFSVIDPYIYPFHLKMQDSGSLGIVLCHVRYSVACGQEIHISRGSSVVLLTSLIATLVVSSCNPDNFESLSRYKIS